MDRSLAIDSLAQTVAAHQADASLTATNDNQEDERFDVFAHDVVAILLRDGLRLLAGQSLH